MIFVSVGLCAACNHGTTLYNGLCDRCRPAQSSNRQDARPKLAPPVTVSVNALFAALLAEFEDEEIAAPLAQRMTLGNIWIDLARLAGETPPAHVLAALDEPIRALPELVATTRRGSFAAWEDNFFEPA